MLHGKFDQSTGRLFIPAVLVLPRLQLSRYMEFLMDTGADNTCLMPTDATTMSVKYEDLRNESHTRGIGGIQKIYRERAFLAFPSVNRIAYGYNLDIAILHPPEDDGVILPSLLGRDVMDHWRVIYSRSENLISAEIRSCDREVPLARA